MFTNELKKGDKVRLRNGWNAEVKDNLKGNIRFCKVYGDYTELGSVYSHDIMYLYQGGNALDIDVAEKTCPHEHMEYTPSQLKCKERCVGLDF